MLTCSSKTYHDLRTEVIEVGLCSGCLGCVAFCAAMGSGALDVGSSGKPRLRKAAQCSECGICHLVCPRTGRMEQHTRQRLRAQHAKDAKGAKGAGPLLTFARASSPAIASMASHGGAVTGLLVHLLETNQITGAVVLGRDGARSRTARLATTPRDLLLAAGHYPIVGHGPALLGELHASLSVSGYGAPGHQGWTRRVAFVGLPEQILALRNLETLGLIPSDAVALYVGLFCDGAYRLDAPERTRLEQAAGFGWDGVMRFTGSRAMRIQLADGRTVVPSQTLQNKLRLPGCAACADYAAELADISFGGLGAPEGWTTVVARSERGMTALRGASRAALAQWSQTARHRGQARLAIEEASQRKRQRAATIRHKHGAASPAGTQEA